MVVSRAHVSVLRASHFDGVDDVVGYMRVQSRRRLDARVELSRIFLLPEILADATLCTTHTRTRHRRPPAEMAQLS